MSSQHQMTQNSTESDDYRIRVRKLGKKTEGVWNTNKVHGEEAATNLHRGPEESPEKP